MFQKLILFLSAIFALSSQSTTVSILAAPLLAASSGTAVFPYDPMQRGLDIYNYITNLSASALGNGINIAEIAIQTTKGLIHNVINTTAFPNIKPTPNYTILLIGSSGRTGNYNPTYLTYYILPVEQIVDVIFSPYGSLASNATFTSSQASGVLPIFPVNISQRATDIANIIPIIQANESLFRYTSGRSSVSFHTTLNGSFPANLPSGVIRYVQCVSLSPPSSACPVGFTGSSNGTELFITYNLQNSLFPQPYFLIASPDQITDFIYTPDK